MPARQVSTTSPAGGSVFAQFDVSYTACSGVLFGTSSTPSIASVLIIRDNLATDFQPRAGQRESWE